MLLLGILPNLCVYTDGESMRGNILKVASILDPSNKKWHDLISKMALSKPTCSKLYVESETLVPMLQCY